MDMLLEEESQGGVVPDPVDDGGADLARLSPGELRERLLERQERIRSLSAELAGRTHALRAMQSRLGESSQSQAETWIAEVARRARGRHRPAPSSLRRHSLLTHLSTRLQELYVELEAMQRRLLEVEGELEYQRQAATQAQGWLAELRRRGRVPDVDAQEVAALQRDLVRAEGRIATLESDLHKKSDALGQMLQKFERSEDGRQDALDRYKTLAAQQDRIVAAFQEQTRRFKALKADRERVIGELEALSDAASPEGQSDLRAEAATLRTRVAELEERVAGGASQAGRLQALEADLGVALARAQGAEALNEQERKRIAALERELERLADERVRLASERNEARQALARGDSGSLHVALEAARKRFGVAEARALEYQMDLEALGERNGVLQEEADGLRARLEAMGATLAEVEGAKAQTAEAHTRSLAELERALGRERARVQELGVELESLQSSQEAGSETLERSRMDAERARQRAESRLSEVEGRIPELEATLQAAQDDLARAQRGSAESAERLKEVEGEIRGLERRLGAAESSRAAAEQAFTRSEAARQLAQGALDSERERRSAAEAQARATEERLESLQGEALSLRSRTERLEEELQAARVAFAEAEEGRSRAQRDRDALKDKVQALQTQGDALESEAGELRAALATERESSRGLGVQLQEVSAQLEEHRDEEIRLRGALREAEGALGAAEARSAAAEARAQQAVHREREARAQTEEATTRATRAREEAEALADRLRGSEAHTQALEARLAEELGAMAELTELRPRLTEAEGERQEAQDALKVERRAHDATREARVALEQTLEGQVARLQEVEQILSESRETSLKLREDLKQSRQAIGELSEERDAAVGALSELRSLVEADAGKSEAWEAERIRLEAEMDSLHQELGLARQAALAGGASAARPRVAALPRRIAPEDPLPSLSSSPPPPEPTEVPRFRDIGDVDPAASLAEGDGLGPGVASFRPREAKWSDEPYAPVHLDRGIEEARDPERAFTSGRTSRRRLSQRTNATAPSAGARLLRAQRDPDDAWEALVAKGRFRETEASDEAEAPEVEEVQTVVWDRPIVDIEHSEPGEAPKVLMMPGVGPTPPAEPTLEEIGALLAAGDVAGALPKARTLWRRAPGDADRLVLFLKASQRSPGAIMEALAELDERLPPQRATDAQARSTSQALLEAGKPGEAAPYLLWILSQAQSPAEHPVLGEAAQLLLTLRESQNPALHRAQVRSALGGLPLPALGAVIFAMEGYALSVAGGRAGDFQAIPAGKADFPGAGLGPSQAAWVRALPTLGARIPPSLFEELEAFNPPQSGVKHRLTFLLLPQTPDANLEKELKRHRRKERHAIVPVPRVELMELLQVGGASKLFKALIKRI